MTEPDPITSDADRIDMTPDERRRSLVAMMIAAFIAGISMGVFVSMLSVILESWGISSTIIGLNSAMPVLGIIAASPFLPALIDRLGALRAIYLGMGIEMVALILLPVFPDVGAWYAIRFIAGIGIAMTWIISETWINAMASEKNRALTMGIFAGLLGGGIAIGPLIIVAVGIEGFTPFLIGIALIALAGVPLFFARNVAPRLNIERAKNFRWVLKFAPIIMVVAIISGVGDEAIFALLPVYGIHAGLAQDDAIYMLTIFVAGTVFLQIPIGWIADRTSRRLALLVCAAAGAIGPVVLPFVIEDTASLYATLFVWGGTVWGVYSLGLALLGEKFGPSALAQANALFVMIYSIGSVAGPVIGGGAMDLWDPHGLPAAVGAGFLLLILIAGLAWAFGIERDRGAASDPAG